MYLNDTIKTSQSFITVVLVAFVLVFTSSTWNAAFGEDKKTDPHVDVFAEDNYPSASQCAVCHQKRSD